MLWCNTMKLISPVRLSVKKRRARFKYSSNQRKNWRRRLIIFAKRRGIGHTRYFLEHLINLSCFKCIDLGQKGSFYSLSPTQPIKSTYQKELNIQTFPRHILPSRKYPSHLGFEHAIWAYWDYKHSVQWTTRITETGITNLTRITNQMAASSDYLMEYFNGILAVLLE